MAKTLWEVNAARGHKETGILGGCAACRVSNSPHLVPVPSARRGYVCQACETICAVRPCPKCFPQPATPYAQPGCADCVTGTVHYHAVASPGEAQLSGNLTNAGVKFFKEHFVLYPWQASILEQKFKFGACIYCGQRTVDGKCIYHDSHTAFQLEETVGCVGGIFCICQPGWGHKSPWRSITKEQSDAWTNDSMYYTGPSEGLQPEPKYRGDCHYTFDIYKVVADIWGTTRREAKTRILKKAFGIEHCLENCPKCGKTCNKKDGHADAGYNGIAGLCWCETCKGWWVKGEKTLTSRRGAMMERDPHWERPQR